MNTGGTIQYKNKEARLLARALELIEAGWTKNDFKAVVSETETRYCAIGAIREAARELGIDRTSETKYNAQRRLHAAIRGLPVEYASASEGVIISWNDRVRTKKEDVVAAFKKTLRNFRATINDDPTLTS